MHNNVSNINNSNNTNNNGNVNKNNDEIKDNKNKKRFKAILGSHLSKIQICLMSSYE